MKEKTEKRGGAGWCILLGLAALVMFAVLELGKYTLPGWVLTVILLSGFAAVRTRLLAGRPFLLRLGAWCALFALFALILWLSRPPVKPVPAVAGKNGGVTGVVHVAQGDLTGVLTEDGQVEVYAGIPYAQPPVGDLRWREPRPAMPWEGVLRADHFAPMSMQSVNSPLFSSLAQIVGYHDYKISLADNYTEPVSEDSLYLNIWKPAGQASELPVLVYIHGGSLQTGQPWYGDYSGQGLARDGVIVVNMGYRLGIFGFFAHPDLASESPNGTTGNYGLLDQIMALQWVRDNIAAFGGDPDNVTLAGESAGSACVTALCTSPLAKGLFRRVICESSTVTAPEPAHSFRTLEEACKAGKATLERFGAGSVEDLRSVSALELAGEMTDHHHITVDGWVLPRTPYEACAMGIHNEEAILQGFNRQEAGPFIIFSQADLKSFEGKVRSAFEEPYASRILALYPVSTDEEAREAWADIYTAVLFAYGHRCLERQAVASGIPTYMYHFTKQNGRLGAWHSGELVYFYGNVPDSPLYTGQDHALSETIRQYIVNFMKTGDPNGPGLVPWPAGTGDNMALELGDEVALRPVPYGRLYDILDEMYGYSSGK